MTFGNNSLTLAYRPINGPGSDATGAKPDGSVDGQADSSGLVTLRFDTLEALAGIATGEGWEERVGGGVKVSMADSWGKNRYVPTSYMSELSVGGKD